MKVLDLQCAHGHAFEGWFSSENDFQDQLARQLLECPLCGDGTITKLPSAPRLNLGAASAAPVAPVAAPPDSGSSAVATPPPELDRKVHGQGRLARPALLLRHGHDLAHRESPLCCSAA